MGELDEVAVPFRWDLASPDQLGSLLAGAGEPDLWFLDSLVACAGKVVARGGDGDLFFVGRSLDSMFDLLSGALSGVAAAPQVRRLPLSFARKGAVAGGRWRKRPLDAGELRQARRILAACGLAPQALARRSRPATFADVVHAGSTFTELFTLLRDWIDEDRAQWDVIRSKLRFVGVTVRHKTSPNTFRWQQHASWARFLPAPAIVNVSLDWPTWTYLADHQVKLTRSFTPDRWLASAAGPDHGEPVRQALAEAVALVGYGRSATGRAELARAISGEPGLAQPWLRSLVTSLSRRG